MKEPLVLVVIAIADTHPSGMPPDLGRHEQEPQPRRRQRRVSHRSYFGAFLAIETTAASSSGCRPTSRSGTSCSSSSSARRDAPPAQHHCWLPDQVLGSGPLG